MPLYEKFNDVSAMLSVLCEKFSTEDMQIMAGLGARMANDKDFEIAYLQAVKKTYMHEFGRIQSKTYQPQPFKKLHTSLLKEIDKTPNKEKMSQPLKARLIDIKKGLGKA